MGVAQGLNIFLDLAFFFQNRNDLGFLFVGRGSEVCKLKKNVKDRQLNNVLFFDEIHPDEIGDLYSQCTAGIISLDPRHKSHNIPGKFLTYIKHGLPVLANINKGNDLSILIKNEKIGQVSESNNLDELVQLTLLLIDSFDSDPDISKRCLSVFDKNFKVKNASRQIINSLFFNQV
jgi:glycosyltransferase involved in cell wall biosynthesis